MQEYTSEKFVGKNGNEVIIRPLLSTDVEEYIHFSEIIACETTHTLHYEGEQISPERVKERFEQASHSNWQREIGGFNNNTLISHLVFFKTRPTHPFEQHIIEFAIKIRKKYWSIGLGTRKLKIMEELAKTMDVKRIQARVRTNNIIGVNFYKKNGYEIEGLKKRAVIINGSFEDEYYIAKLLN